MVVDDAAVSGAGERHDIAGALGGAQVRGRSDAERGGEGHARQVVDDAVARDGVVGTVDLRYIEIKPFIVVGEDVLAESDM